MNLLLDTHVFLWWDARDPALNDNAQRAIENPRNNIFVSAASVWEIAIKRRLGKLSFHGSISAAIGANGFLETPILPIDAEAAGDMSWHRSDPFDRLLVAQATKQGMVLVTADQIIQAKVAVARLRAN